MGKFAQRGLAQSMARELHPHGVHVAWINIDGAISNPHKGGADDGGASKLDPEAIARSYLHLIDFCAEQGIEYQRLSWPS